MNRADALMQEIKKDEGGRLTVFLGAAPGVGKTYAMLARARELFARGESIVLGIVESHGRAETFAMCEGLPFISPVWVEHKGHRLAEFNLQEVLELKPATVLVDELAHTNAPGSLHQYRWQDVEALLKAGINVHTTLNVQHVESLNDLVLQLTGIRVRETVPDSIFKYLKDIRLIDLPPAELIERMIQGKVYAKDLADQALGAFFTPSNLSALRELAMEVVSRYVDQDALEKRAAHGQDAGPLRKHVLIAINDLENAEYLIRAGSRLAERRGATWSSVAVVGRTDQFDLERRADLDAVASLVRKLGGEFELAYHSDVVAGILQVAESRNALAILLGRGRESRIARILNQTLSQQLITRAQRYEVTIVGRAELENIKRPENSSRFSYTSKDLLITSTVSSFSVLAAWLAEHFLGFTDLSAIFLIAVLYVAARTNQFFAIVSALICFMAYNFFFIHPRFTFEISAEQGVITVFMFLITGLIAGSLASRLRQQVDALQAANQFGLAQQQLTQQLSSAADLHQVIQAGTKALSNLSGAESWIRIGNLAESPRPVSLSGERDLFAAKHCEETGEECGRFTNTLSGSSWWFLPLPIDGKKIQGVVGFFAPSTWKSPPEATRRLLQRMLSDIREAALRTCLVNELETARVTSETEKLRSALLSSVSHDLRSPLSVMIGAADSLHSLGGGLNPSDQKELVDTIRTEGHRLDRYIQNLLDMTRLGHQGLSLKREWVLIEDILGSASQRLKRYNSTVKFKFDVQQDLPVLHVHPALIEQALFNVMENAAKFSPPDHPVLVKVSQNEIASLAIEICDSGPGIPDDERKRIFDMFYTMERGDRGRMGTGLGLTIVQGIIGSHLGTVEAVSGPDGKGTTVRIKLPIGSDSPGNSE